MQSLATMLIFNTISSVFNGILGIPEIWLAMGVGSFFTISDPGF